MFCYFEMKVHEIPEDAFYCDMSVFVGIQTPIESVLASRFFIGAAKRQSINALKTHRTEKFMAILNTMKMPSLKVLVDKETYETLKSSKLKNENDTIFAAEDVPVVALEEPPVFGNVQT
jgi:hypothetical protein